MFVELDVGFDSFYGIKPRLTQYLNGRHTKILTTWFVRIFQKLSAFFLRLSVFLKGSQDFFKTPKSHFVRIFVPLLLKPVLNY